MNQWKQLFAPREVVTVKGVEFQVVNIGKRGLALRRCLRTATSAATDTSPRPSPQSGAGGIKMIPVALQTKPQPAT